MDGLTTNGVLVMHPRHGFSQDSKPGVWREISVCGNVFTLRETRSAQQRGKMVREAACAVTEQSPVSPREAGWLFADCLLLRGRLIMKLEYPEKLQRAKVKSQKLILINLSVSWNIPVYLYHGLCVLKVKGHH